MFLKLIRNSIIKQTLSFRRISQACPQYLRYSTSSTPPSHPKPSIEPRLFIGFTCNICKARSNKFMSKKAYNHGVVIIKCDNCKSHHLIADHLGWYDTTKKSPGTIEDIMRIKGESVNKINFNADDLLGNDNNDASDDDIKEIEQGLLEFLPKKI